MPDEPREPMTTDQKRARLILVVVGIMIAVVGIGIVAIVTTLGVPLWIAVLVAIFVGAIIALVMFFELA